jgi:hypothetical protein
MSAPWEPDRPLTVNDASALIRQSFPAIDSRGLKHIGSGWEFDAFLTNDGWVFRFPRRAESAKFFDAERRVHKLVAGRLPPGVAIPRAHTAAVAWSVCRLHRESRLTKSTRISRPAGNSSTGRFTQSGTGRENVAGVVEMISMTRTPRWIDRACSTAALRESTRQTAQLTRARCHQRFRVYFASSS